MSNSKVPAIPSTHAVQDQEARRVLDALKESVEVRNGQRGDKGERFVTWNELQAALASLKK